MSSLVPIGVIAETPQPDIAMKASSEIPVPDAACCKESLTEKCEASTKEYDVIHTEKSSMLTSELPCNQVDASNAGHAARQKRNEALHVISFIQEDTPSYFTSSYYRANEHCPFKCFNCDACFSGDSYKVSSK